MKKSVYSFEELSKLVCENDTENGVFFDAPTAEDFKGKNMVETTATSKIRVQFFNPRNSLKDWDGSNSPLVDYCDTHGIDVFVTRFFNNVCKDDPHDCFSILFCQKGKSLFAFHAASWALSLCATNNETFTLEYWVTGVDKDRPTVNLSVHGSYDNLYYDSGTYMSTFEALCNQETGEFSFWNNSFATKTILALETLQTDRDTLTRRFPNIPLDQAILAPFDKPIPILVPSR